MKFKVIDGGKPNNIEIEPHISQLFLTFEQIRRLHGTDQWCESCLRTRGIKQTIYNVEAEIIDPLHIPLFFTPIEKILIDRLYCIECNTLKKSSINPIQNLTRSNILSRHNIHKWLTQNPNLKHFIISIPDELLNIDEENNKRSFDISLLCNPEIDLFFYNDENKENLTDCGVCGGDHELIYGNWYKRNEQNPSVQYSYFGPLHYCPTAAEHIMPSFFQNFIQQILEIGYSRIVLKPLPDEWKELNEPK